MRLIGFNFNKINVEKLSSDMADLKVNTNVDVTEINEVESDMFQLKEALIGAKFVYKIDYEPNIARIEFAGSLIFGTESKIAKDILKQWQDKKIPEDFRMFLFNVILRKSNLKALQLEDEMNLPPHIPLPGLRKPEDKEKKDS